MAGIPVVDRKDIVRSGRNVPVPFRVILQSDLKHKPDNPNIEITCTHALRIIPAKRLVCSGSWDGNPVIVKFYLKLLDGKRHCKREVKGVEAFKKAGIKTPELLYRGNLESDSTPVLVFKKIEPSDDFALIWARVDNDGERVELLKRLVSAFAYQHEAGIKQDDVHLKNYMMSGKEIYFIDGGGVDAGHSGTPLAVAKSIRNLGALFSQFYQEFDRLIPEVFPTYAGIRSLPVNSRSFRRLDKEIDKQRRKRKNAYFRKIYRECTAFVCKKSWQYYMVCDRNEYSEELIRFINNIDNEIESSRLLKKGNSSTVGLVELNGRSMIVKRYNIKNFAHAISRCFRPSRAWISWKNAHLLGFMGVLTPMPIMFLERRLGIFRSKAYFLMEYVKGKDCYHLLHSDRVKAVEIKTIVKQFRQLLQTFADTSVLHGDLKATNFLVVENGELYVLDLDSMTEYRLRYGFKKRFNKKLKRLMKNWDDLPEVYDMFGDELAKLKI